VSAPTVTQQARRQPPGPRRGGVESYLDPTHRVRCYACLKEFIDPEFIFCDPCWKLVPAEYTATRRAPLRNEFPPCTEKAKVRADLAIKAVQAARGEIRSGRAAYLGRR